MKEKLYNKKFILLYLIVFAAIFALSFLFPYTGDDWAWGSQIGIDRLNEWFDNYSGRYFGNLIVLALTRSRLLRNISVTFVLGGIIVMLNELTGRTKIGLSLTCLLMAVMPAHLLRQSVVWTSGFSNYSTSIFFVLIYCIYIRNIFTEQPKNNIKSTLPVAILGFLSALIVEHITAYCLVLGIWVVLYCIVKYKKVFAQHIAYIVGTVAGTITMLSNSVYKSVSSSTDDYRHIENNGVNIFNRIGENFSSVIMKDGFLNNLALSITTLVVCIAVFAYLFKLSSKSVKVLRGMSLVVQVVFVITSICRAANNYKSGLELFNYHVTITVLYIAAIILFAATLPSNDFCNVKMRALFAVCSAVVTILPLLVVTPIGSRCLFASYIFFILFDLQLLSIFGNSAERVLNIISYFVFVGAIIGYVSLVNIYYQINTADRERINNAVQQSKTQSEVYVSDLPYKDYIWCDSVDEEIWATRFKMFYGIDENVTIIPK